MKKCSSVETEIHRLHAFLDGIRPVMLVGPDWVRHLSDYRQVPLCDGNVLVFQYDIDADMVLRECVQDGVICDTYRLALRSGEPPASSYATVYETPHPEDVIFHVSFVGMEFKSYPKTIDKDLRWLKNQMRIHRWEPTYPFLEVAVELEGKIYPYHHIGIHATLESWERLLRQTYREPSIQM